jgi:threonine dehydrogenase-like Zn-dependent dehydrogenase
MGTTDRRERVSFTAAEYQPDGTIRPARYAYAGSPGEGWEIVREGRVHLRLGPGYRLLRTSHCGICATDLARRYLPFRLPQITGHEVVALDDERGTPVAVEINASHVARGLAPAEWCGFCRSGLHTHCPDRIVLGIHDLPGGFAPWILAPLGSVVEIPDGVSAATATLIEPFAAALRAVETIAPAAGARVAVLGPRRLGSAVIAALAAWRRNTGRACEIIAIVRRPELGWLARELGADDVLTAEQAAEMENVADIVVDTTGNPAALPLAVRLAKAEVHVKSTTGQPALGLAHLTEMVVDEIAVCSLAAMALDRIPPPLLRTAVVVGEAAGRRVEAELRARGVEVLAVGDPAAPFQSLSAVGDASAGDAGGCAGPGTSTAAGAGTSAGSGATTGACIAAGGGSSLHAAAGTGESAGAVADIALPQGGADLAIVASTDMLDRVLRRRAGHERGLVRPRGTICIADVGQARDSLLATVLDKGLRLSTSRCGDLRAAVAMLADPAARLGKALGERMVTDVLPASALPDAFARAAGTGSIKVVVAHPHGALSRRADTASTEQ